MRIAVAILLSQPLNRSFIRRKALKTIRRDVQIVVSQESVREEQTVLCMMPYVLSAGQRHRCLSSQQVRDRFTATIVSKQRETVTKNDYKNTLPFGRVFFCLRSVTGLKRKQNLKEKRRFDLQRSIYSLASVDWLSRFGMPAHPETKSQTKKFIIIKRGFHTTFKLNIL